MFPVLRLPPDAAQTFATVVPHAAIHHVPHADIHHVAHGWKTAAKCR